MSHHCHARNCQTPVKPELLMCFRHWKIVPRKIQQAVWKYYRPGQCDDKQPSPEWHQAADAAIGFVANQEGFLLRPSEQDALNASGFGRSIVSQSSDIHPDPPKE